MMRKILLLVSLIIITSSLVSGQTCGGSFYDNGGPTGNYANSSNTTTTICPTNPGDLVTVTFNSFNTEQGWDPLFIYNGNSAASPLISSGNAGSFGGFPAGGWWGSTILPHDATSTNSVTSTDATGCLTFVFMSDASFNYPGWDASVSCAPAPACPQVTALSSNTVTAHNATIAWTPGGTETAWNLQYGTNATQGGAGNTTVAITTNPYTLTGLAPGTVYYVWVQANCGGSGTANWTGPITFTTGPACGGTFYDAGGPSANYPTNANQTWTICPDNVGDIVTVTFNSFQTENNWDALYVYDGNSTASPLISSGSGTTFSGFPAGGWSGTNTPHDVTSTNSITATSTSGCLTFVFRSDAFITYAGWAAPITCSPPPACQRPSAVTITNITDYTADVSWTGPANAASWVIEYGPQGFTVGSGTVVTSATNSITLTGLSPGANYSVYVHADCGASGPSINSGPYNFLTTCLLPGNSAPGDTYATAIVAGTLPFSGAGNTNSPCVHNDNPGRPSKDIYYTFSSGPCASSITVSLCGSSYDTYLYVYDYTGGGTPIAFNDDFCGVQSQVTFAALPNTTYYAVVEGFSSTSAGAYNINITENIAAGSNLYPYYDIQSPTCASLANGYVNINVCGGTPPYRAVWDDVDTALVRHDLAAGRYVVRISDAAGASTVDTIYVHQNAPLSASVTPAGNVTLCPGTSVNLNGSPVNGNEFPQSLNIYAAQIPNGRFVHFNGANTLYPEMIANNLQYNSYAGGDFTNFGYMAISNAGNQLVLVDTASGATFNVGTSAPASGEVWTGLAFNASANLLFGTSTNGTTNSTLFAIDPNSGTSLAIGSMGIRNAAWIAIDNNGLAYALDAASDSLYAVDLGSGSTIGIGPVGFDATQAQDADFDPVTNKLYGSSYNAATHIAEFRVFDVTTGASTSLGALSTTPGVQFDGIAIASYTGGFTYNWSPAAGLSDPTISNPVATPTGTTTYTFQVTDACGATATSSVTVTVPNALQTTLVGTTTPSCIGSANATVDINVTQGTTPYTYAWSNGATTQDLSGVSAGTYTITITDACGVTGSATTTVANPTAIAATVSSAVNASCQGNADGEIILAVSGATAPYTFAWSNGATDQNLSSLVAGTYTLTVTDANGCTSAIPAITISAPQMLTVTPTVNAISCANANNGSINIAVSGGTSAYTYHWTNGATTQNITGLSAGTYVGIVTDANGCSWTSPAIQITAPAAINLGTSSTPETGAGNDGTATVTPTGGVAPYTYHWSNNATTATATGLAPGGYNITVTDANGCTAEASVSVAFFVGFNNIAGLTNIQLFPNPAITDAALKVEFSETKQEVSVEIFNNLSQVIGTMKASNVKSYSFPINVSNLPAGNYFIRLNADGQMLTRPISVVK